MRNGPNARLQLHIIPREELMLNSWYFFLCLSKGVKL